MPIYTFNLTGTDSRIFTKMIDLEEHMTINELKIKLVGPIINSLGYDKIKFFQTGKQFGEDNIVGEFNEHERVLIFPMIPSLRTILVKSFTNNDDETSDDEEQEEREVEVEGEECKEVEGEKEEMSMVDEEPPKMEFKETDEILKLNSDTLGMFKNADMMLLMEIYFRNRSGFIDFIDYIAQGHFNEFDTSVSINYPSEMLDDIRGTFNFLEDLSNDELIMKLDNVGGNLDLLVSTYMANLEN